MGTQEKNDTSVATVIFNVIQMNNEDCRDSGKRALAASDSSITGQARLCAGQGVATAQGSGRGGGEELRLRPAGQRRDARGLRLADGGDCRTRRRGLRL